MATFTISTLAGRVVAELPLEDGALDLVVADLLQHLPPLDCAGGVPRLLLGPRELGWSERLADLALAPGADVTLVLVADAEKAASDLMGIKDTPVRLAAAKVLRTMGAAAARQAEDLADAVLSDPDARVVDEALQALRAMGAAVELAFVTGAKRLEVIVQLAQDLEDPQKPCCELCDTIDLRRRLLALLARCDMSPGQAALRGRTVLRRLAPLDLEAARRHDPLLPDPLEDPKPEVRLAAVAVLGLRLVDFLAPQDPDAITGRLCSVLQGDACLEVRRRAAATLGRACWHYRTLGLPAGLLAGGLLRARAALDAEVETLQTSALPADCSRMQAVQSIKQLLG